MKAVVVQDEGEAAFVAPVGASLLFHFSAGDPAGTVV
jgi:hypothetical protein